MSTNDETVPTPDQFRDMLRRHDATYAMSDDPRRAREGRERVRQFQALADRDPALRAVLEEVWS